MNVIDLKGQSAIVTGGARGIGYAIAERFIASGAEVAVWDLDEAAATKAAKALGGRGKTHAAVVDVSDRASVRNAFSTTVRAMGRIDILVNNAGIAGPNAKVWEYDPAEWRRVIEIDLVGVFLCCAEVLPSMLAQGYGRIVNIASVAGKEGNPNASAYSAAKAGVIGLTKSIGKETAETGVIANCVTPAAVETEIFAQLTPEFIAYMRSKIPMGRFGKVGEIAALVAWLASKECSFSTGAAFDISGGRATY